METDEDGLAWTKAKGGSLGDTKSCEDATAIKNRKENVRIQIPRVEEHGERKMFWGGLGY